MAKNDDNEAAAEWFDVDALSPWSRNPRRNDKAVPEVAASIKRFGFGAPIVARRADGMVIAGHTRLKAAQSLGLTRVPVRWLDLDVDEAQLLALADNKVAEIAEWDDDMLADVLRDLDIGEATEGLGFSEEELAELLKATEPAAPVGDDVPEVDATEAHSVPGQVYQLGLHRLACGDSTDPEVWARLMGGQRAQMVWTDPPYGVAYVGKTADALVIENDRLDNDGLDAMLSKMLAAVMPQVEPGAAWYVAAPPGPRGVAFANALLREGLFRQRLAWIKNALVLGHSDYHYQHEDIYYGFQPGAPGRRGRGGEGWFGDNSQTTALCFDKPTRNGEHPTMKPVALVQYCIRNSSQPGWRIADPFGGSGTTLMAAAAEGRVAFLCELDPKYCDVIRRRWTRYADENGLDAGAGALQGAA